MKKRFLTGAVLIAALLILLLCLAVLYRYHYIPHKKYQNSDFYVDRQGFRTDSKSGTQLQSYISHTDKDGDGIDDQTDIVNNVKAYLATKPKYKSKYYEGGYPDDEYGVCTDVAAFALRDAGYDLMTLVQDDIAAHPDDYPIEEPDSNIDFRRVKKLKIFFAHTAVELTKDTSRIEEWQAGDIVIYDSHIAICSDHRNKKGVPFLFHNAHPFQASYEEDALETYGTIVGHYRISL